mmetsp:Transcript_15898/g.43934  ORF Transcript_15898/g.43934 Transcript_15898/m.43934 type:complete len:366 (-) Transcript_15898:147-1244(-)
MRSFCVLFLCATQWGAPRNSNNGSRSSSLVAEAMSTPFGQTTKNVATQVLQGAGQATVDLNQYNLPSIEDIQNEWTASVVQKATEQEGKIYLQAKNDRELFADVVRVVFPRLPTGGLGLELFELAGGRDDGVGITLVNGLVDGGSAAAAGDIDIVPGDSLVQVALIRMSAAQQAAALAPPSDEDDEAEAQTANGMLAESADVTTVNLECLSYDATVEALSELPPPLKASSPMTELFEVTLKRIRRKPKVTVNLQYPPSEKIPDETITMYAGENLRQGMLIRGVKLNDPLAKRFDTKNGGNCGAGGLCRTCAVSVSSGSDLLNPQRLAEQQMLADTPRWRLACKSIVGFGMKEGEMTVRVSPNQWD